MKHLPALLAGSAASLALTAAASAASLQTLSNEVADGTIVITPADRTDWAGVTAYAPIDVDAVLPVLSIETISIAHDSTNFYFRFHMDAAADPAVDPFQSFFSSHHAIMIDTDQDRATGALTPDGNLSVGANYMVEGPGLFRFGNLANPGGADQQLWTWGGIIPFGSVAYDDDPVTDIEFAIPRASLGNPESFDFVAFTSDVAFTTTDAFPNTSFDSDTGDFFTYSTVAVGGITGDFNASGQVEQGDLDLVLQNWGDDTNATGIPSGWTNDNDNLGQIEQTELDRVLQNWGSTSAPDFSGSAVPEPATLALLSLGGLALLRRRTA